MDEKKAFLTERAAIIGGPYSQAVIHKGIVYVSGQGAIDPCTNRLSLGSIEEEAGLAIENMKIILEDAGSSLEKVLQVTVYLINMKEYVRFNNVYKRYFKGVLPARTCIEAAGLPLGIRLEMDAIAYI